MFPENVVVDPNEMNYEAHAYQTSVDDYATGEKPEFGDGDIGALGEDVDVGLFTVCYPKLIDVPFYPYYIPHILNMNGYERVDECFYNTLGKKGRDTRVFGWTEETEFIPYWRFPERTAFVQGNATGTGEKGPKNIFPLTRPDGGQNTIGEEIKGPIPKAKAENWGKWLRENTCASYRANAWPERFSILEEMIGIKPREADPKDDPLNVQCYQDGELFPLVGNLRGNYPYHTGTTLSLIHI